MRKKLAPGVASTELPALDTDPAPRIELGRPEPLAREHPLSLRERIRAGRSDFPMLGTLPSQSAGLSDAVRLPSRPSSSDRVGTVRMEASPEFPAFGAMAGRPGPKASDAETVRKTGTTTVGVVTKDACVLATDHRASAGRLVSHTDTQKLFDIEKNLGMTIAGLVGDAQDLVRTLRAEAKLYSMKHDRPMPVRAAAGIMANLLNQRKFAPFEVALLIGGVDRTGPHLYSLDEAGGSIPDKWCTTGSGSPFVYGVLEDHYRDGLTTSDAIDLCIRGLNASTRRDSASGNGFDLAVIDAKGFQWVPREETDRRLRKLGLPPIPK